LLGGPATFARDNATLNINVYNNNNTNTGTAVMKQYITNMTKR